MNSGMGWGNAQAPATGNTKDIERLDFKNKKELQVRLVGIIIPRYVRWVTTKEAKQRTLECLSFNRETCQFDSSLKDPFNEIPPEIYGAGDKEKPQFSYVTHAIDRSDGKLKLFDPLKKTVFDKIIVYARKADYGDPSHPDTGYDLTITQVKTGPKPQNVRYDVMPSSRSTSPLSAKEREMEMYDLEKLFKRPTYEEQKAWLQENTTYYMSLMGDEGQVESAKDL